jgi:hypothetical protein
MRVGGSSEELAVGPPIEVEQKGWALLPDGIVFTERSGKALDVYEFSKKRTRFIASLGGSFLDGRENGVSVSLDAQWVLYSQLDRWGSNIMVAEAP